MTKSAASVGRKETVMRYVRTLVVLLLLVLGLAAGARASGPVLVPSGLESS